MCEQDDVDVDILGRGSTVILCHITLALIFNVDENLRTNRTLLCNEQKVYQVILLFGVQSQKQGVLPQL